MSGYIYGDGRSTTAGILQQAIWYLQGEVTTIDAGNQFLALAQTELGTLVKEAANGKYGVQALNIGEPGKVQ